jgi:hypothetical protein
MNAAVEVKCHTKVSARKFLRNFSMLLCAFWFFATPLDPSPD